MAGFFGDSMVSAAGTGALTWLLSGAAAAFSGEPCFNASEMAFGETPRSFSSMI